MLCTDSFPGRICFIIVDRYSGWLSVYKAAKDRAAGFITTMKEYFSAFGIARQVTSGGTTVY